MIRSNICRMMVHFREIKTTRLVNNCFKRTIWSLPDGYQKVVFRTISGSYKNTFDTWSPTGIKQVGRFRTIQRPPLCSGRRCMSSSNEEEASSTDQISNKEIKPDDSIPKSLQSKFSEFRDEDAVLIPDDEEEYQKQLIAAINDQNEDDDKQFSIYRRKKSEDILLTDDLQRGVEGVFDIEELVKYLKSENVADICVIEIPPERQYCDYMVIATSLTGRHGRAVAEFIKKLYKRKKNRYDKGLTIEGDKASPWQAMDMGNIVLHVFSEECRQTYDLEMLWTVGEEFDDQYQQKDIYKSLVDQFTYLGDIVPLGEADKEPLTDNAELQLRVDDNVEPPLPRRHL